MANRGICLIQEIGGFQEEGLCQVTFSYVGFTHSQEQFGSQADITPTMLTGIALKAAIQEHLVTWYAENHADWPDWDSTPILGDTFTLIGGLL